MQVIVPPPCVEQAHQGGLAPERFHGARDDDSNLLLELRETDRLLEAFQPCGKLCQPQLHLVAIN